MMDTLGESLGALCSVLYNMDSYLACCVLVCVDLSLFSLSEFCVRFFTALVQFYSSYSLDSHEYYNLPHWINYSFYNPLQPWDSYSFKPILKVSDHLVSSQKAPSINHTLYFLSPSLSLPPSPFNPSPSLLPSFSLPLDQHSPKTSRQGQISGEQSWQ